MIDFFYEMDTKPLIDLKNIIIQELEANGKVFVESECDFKNYLKKIKLGSKLAPHAFFFIDIDRVEMEEGTLLTNAFQQTVRNPAISSQTLYSFLYMLNTAHYSGCVSKQHLTNGNYKRAERVQSSLNNDFVLISNSNIADKL